MALVITDQELEGIQLTASELLVELACYLYKTKRLSLGKAKKLANLGQIEFQQELSKRDIDIHFTKADLDQDLKNLGIEL